MVGNVILKITMKQFKKYVKSADHIFLDRIDIQVEIQAVPFKESAGNSPANLPQTCVSA